MEQFIGRELVECWDHAGLRQLDRNAMSIQLVSIPSFSGITSWTLFDEKDDSVLIRRVQEPPGQRTVPRAVFGSEAQLPRSSFETIRRRVDALDLQSVRSSRFGIDGTSRCVRWPADSNRLDIMWWETSGSEELDDWFEQTTLALDRLLPAYSVSGTPSSRLTSGQVEALRQRRDL